MTTTRVSSERLDPGCGRALEVRRGQTLRVVDLEGKQVVDLVVFNLGNLREKLSMSDSRSRYFLEPGARYTPRTRLHVGDWLMSTLCRPLMTIMAETAELKGIHDTHHRTCNRFFFAVYGGLDMEGCHEILARAVEPYGLLPEDIPDSFNISENYPFDCDFDRFVIDEPVTKPGDYLDLRAEVDGLVAVANCPEDVGISDTNAGHCTPVQLEVHVDPSPPVGPELSASEWLGAELARRGRSVSQRRG